MRVKHTQAVNIICEEEVDTLDSLSEEVLFQIGNDLTSMHKPTTQLHHHHYDCHWFWGFRLGLTNIRKNCERTHHVQLHTLHKEIIFVKRTEVFKTVDCTYRCLLATVLLRVSLKSSHDFGGFCFIIRDQKSGQAQRLGFRTRPLLQITIFHG